MEKPSIWGVDEDGKSYDNILSLAECFVVGGQEFSIKIFAGCQIAGLIPGRVKVRVQLFSQSQNETIGIDIDIDIIPKSISLFSNPVNIELQDWQNELWLSVSGLKYREFYRATMSGFLPNGTVLNIVPNMNDFSGVCSNRVPFNKGKVACYFETEDNQTIVIVKNDQKRLFTAQIFIENIREINQASVSYYANKAIPIILNLPISEYVFANESGVKNSHYFRFRRDTETPTAVKVILSYSHEISLDVAWGSGVCTKQMLKTAVNQVSCIVPKSAMGELIIRVDGNNDVNLSNAPAAVEGGSSYELVVQSVQ